MSLSRYPRYPAYKDSGVEWLGEVPAHWEVRRLRNTVKSCQNGTWGADPNGDDDAICVRVADFDRLRFSVRLTEPTFRSIPRSEFAHKRLACGDLLLEKSGGGENQPVGAVVQFDHEVDAVCSNFVASMPVAEGHVSRYLAYLHASLYSIRVNTRHIKQSTGIQNLDADGYLAELVPIPTLKEQTEISLFLDRETARIDALIEKKRRLIELLQEQRAAIITRAVTRGLDPHAPTKNSGVEWLGEIPAHWSALRLKQLLTQIEQGWSPDCENRIAAPEEWGVMKAGCVNGGRFNQMEHKTLPAEVYPPKSLEIRPGDLLMSRASGSRELVGSVAVVRECRSQLLLCDKLFRLYPDDQNDARYLVYALSGKSARAQIEVALSGGSGMANNIAQSVVKDLLLGVPHREEQVRIANFLDHETTRFDSVAKVVYRAMDQLLELRSSLITAAVTGAIDVRASLDADARIDAA